MKALGSFLRKIIFVTKSGHTLIDIVIGSKGLLKRKERELFAHAHNAKSYKEGKLCRLNRRSLRDIPPATSTGVGSCRPPSPVSSALGLWLLDRHNVTSAQCDADIRTSERSSSSRDAP